MKLLLVISQTPSRRGGAQEWSQPKVSCLMRDAWTGSFTLSPSCCFYSPYATVSLNLLHRRKNGFQIILVHGQQLTKMETSYMSPLVKTNPIHKVIVSMKCKLFFFFFKDEKKNTHSQKVTNPALLLRMPPCLEPNTKTHTQLVV